MTESVKDMAGVPRWWHHHGFKVHVESLSEPKRRLKLSASAVDLLIGGAAGDDEWFFEWEVRHGTLESVTGRVFMTDSMLAAAFGLLSYTQPGSEWLLQEYDADCAGQGCYIRFRGWLNIPCPGTGHDGDPNISIRIDTDIRDAARSLLPTDFDFG